MKKTIKYLSLVAILLIVITGCGSKKEKVLEERVNTNKGVIEDKEVEGLKLTNTSLVSTEDNAQLVTKVSNDGTTDVEVRIFNIYVKDKNNEVITKLEGYVGGIIPAGESREIISNVDMNLEHAYNVEYELVK